MIASRLLLCRGGESTTTTTATTTGPYRSMPRSPDLCYARQGRQYTIRFYQASTGFSVLVLTSTSVSTSRLSVPAGARESAFLSRNASPREEVSDRGGKRVRGRGEGHRGRREGVSVRGFSFRAHVTRSDREARLEKRFRVSTIATIYIAVIFLS